MRTRVHSATVSTVHPPVRSNTVSLASFLHHIFIVSPDGQYLLKLIENVHRLIPYKVARQTLRIGNAATMINGMVRLMLTKLSVTAITNWIGLSSNPNDGMNMLQQIISTALGWDVSDHSRKAAALEAFPDAPSKAVLTAIRAHVHASRERHEAARAKSMAESTSIVAAILDAADPPCDVDALTSAQHGVAMEYYSRMQSIKDREELIKVMCKMQPDHLTAATRDLITAYEPLIRAVHNAADLSSSLSDLEALLTELIQISKPRSRANGVAHETTRSRHSSRHGSRHGSRSSSRHGSRPSSRNDSPRPSAPAPDDVDLPCVEDYVRLIRKHAPAFHSFLYQVCKNGPEVAAPFREYAKACAAEFRPPSPGSTEPASATGQESAALPPHYAAIMENLFAALPRPTRTSLLPVLNHHSFYLSTLSATSTARVFALFSATSPFRSCPTVPAMSHGPGIYLSRWHALLSSTLITPAQKRGRVRWGWEVSSEGDAKGAGAKRDSGLGFAFANGEDMAANGDAQSNDVVDDIETKERMKDGRQDGRVEQVWTALSAMWGSFLSAGEVMGAW